MNFAGTSAPKIAVEKMQNGLRMNGMRRKDDALDYKCRYQKKATPTHRFQLDLSI
jgi:hypothetical protein